MFKMDEEIIFYFVYNDNDGYKKHLDILVEVFGSYILDNIKNVDLEKIVSIKLDNFNNNHLFDLLAQYDDEIRVLRVGDDLIIGLHSHLEQVGL